MIRFALFVAIAFGAAYFLYQIKDPPNAKVVLHNLKEKISQGQFTEVADLDALMEARKVSFEPDMTHLSPSADLNDPRLRFQYLHNNTSAVVPGDGVMTGITLLKDKPIRLVLENATDYEIIRMFASQDPAFSDESLVFDWSKRGINSYLFYDKAFKYPYYRVQFKSVINKDRPREALFYIASRVATTPLIQLTYQSPQAGTKAVELRPISETNQENFRIRVSPNSLLGLKIDLAGQTLTACYYRTPGNKAADCLAQMAHDFVSNVTSQDVGVHNLSIKTDRSEYQFKFEIEPLP